MPTYTVLNRRVQYQPEPKNKNKQTEPGQYPPLVTSLAYFFKTQVPAVIKVIIGTYKKYQGDKSEYKDQWYQSDQREQKDQSSG